MALSMLAAAMDAVAQAGAAAPDPVAWTPQHWDALGNVLLGVGAVVGGAFGLYTYRKATRTREAEWLDRLFERFYLNPTFSPLLLSFEYEFVAGTNRLVDRVLTVDTPVLAPAEIERIRSVDVVLNFLEHLLYLESDRHLLARDRDALFGYWLGLLSRPRYASLRQYALHFNYEHVATYCKARKVEHVFLYGSLMRGHAEHVRRGLDQALEFVGEAWVPGRIYPLPPGYPGLKFSREEDGARAHGELFRVRDERILRDLDDYEEYFPDRMERSEYARRLVHVPGAGVDAWVYEYLGEVEGIDPVQGRWRADAAGARGASLTASA
jgi:gamma-glutamylcyclotransferase (GGCT)/AIG2-like uncharacterized protein YtfP